jgi:hypothetical protein
LTLVLALAGDSTTTTFMKVQNFEAQIVPGYHRAGRRIERNMGKSPPPVKSGAPASPRDLPLRL